MKTLNDSLIYNTLVKTPGLINSLKSINIDVDAVELRSLSDTLNMINKRMNYPTKAAIIKMLQEERAKIIWNPTRVKTPKYFDVFGKMYMNKPVYLVNIGRYAKGTRDNLDMNPRTLYALLQNALIYGTMNEKWETIVNNDIIKKAGCIAYSKLASKILVKLFAIDTDKMKSDFIRFMLAKFYLKSMAGLHLQEAVLNDIAHKACISSSTLQFLVGMESQIVVDDGEDLYKNLDTLFKGMRQIQGLNSLTIRGFAENWARMYGEGSILCMDFLPNFLGMLCGVVVTGGLVKDPILVSICEHEILEVFNAIARSM